MGEEAYVTSQHAQEASQWEKKTHLEKTESGERKRSLNLKGAFSFQTRVFTLWKRQGKKKHNSTSEDKESAKPARSFVKLGGSENVFKSFKSISKKQIIPISEKEEEKKDFATNCQTRSGTAISPD